MLSQFPPAARLSHRDEYPKVLRERLVLWQAPEILVDPRTCGPQRPGRLARFVALGCVVASMSIAVCTLIGVYTLLSWIT